MASRAADVLLSDGTAVQLRQMQPSDADALVAMHSRFSERTRYLRFFSPYPRIPPRDLERFVNVDHTTREALIVLSGPNMVGVGRYERLGPSSPEAEVAFAVEDAYQGRGVGSVLLEHLAAAAREAGIERFVAEVLPANDTMLRVFADAGFEVTRRYADGVVHLVFPVAQTERSLAVQWDREHRTEARSVARILRPSSIAIYGASSSGRGVGAAILSHLTSGGFPGPILAVNPHGPIISLSGAPASAPLAAPGAPASAPSAAPGPAAAGVASAGGVQSDSRMLVDLAIVAVPPASIAAVIDDAGAAGVHGLLVITELDPAQRRSLVERAHARGMRVVGPGSLGLADYTAGLNATLVPRLPKPGRVALFCQSGTLGLQLLAEADRRGLGMSSFASVGRRADVSGNDLLQFWADDPDTDIIVMYLETFGNPRKFSRIAREVGRRKPIIVLASETGLGSTLDASALDALRARSGVIEAATVSELFDVASILATQPLPGGDRIGIVSNAFAVTALAGAKVRGAGLRVGRSGALSTAATPVELADAARTTLDSADADALLVIVAPPLPTGPVTATGATVVAPYLAALNEIAEGADKPVVVISLLGGGTIEEAVRALTHAVRRAEWLREPAGMLPEPRHHPVSSLDEALSEYGLPVLKSLPAASTSDVIKAAKALGYPVVLKAVKHQHRIDIGAVRLNLGEEKLVKSAYADLVAAFGPEVVVQSMAPPGVACTVEVRDDPAFGPVIGFGLGGPVTELVGDKAWRAVPLTDLDAKAIVRAPKAAPMLAEADLASLEQLVIQVGQLADEVPRLRTLRLNPVLVHENGWTILHAEGEMDDPADRPDSGPRKL